LSRSSYKGYYFCKKLIKLIKLKITSKRCQKYPKLQKYSTIHNEFSNLGPFVHTGFRSLHIPLRTLSSVHKIGELIFTRKPYVYPYKKNRNIK
jgi:ribosomal protein S19